MAAVTTTKSKTTSAASAAMLDPTVRVVAAVSVSAAVSVTAHNSSAANPYWEWDRRWHASSGSWVDATICADRHGNIKPISEVPTGGCTDDHCKWGFWKANIPCSAQAFADVMFQSVRYTWCQTQLAALLTHKPWQTPGQTIEQKASLAAQWCLDVMRLVSMARYATNVSSEYLPQWAPWTTPDRKDFLQKDIGRAQELGEDLSPNTQAAYDELFSYLPPGVADSASFHHMLSIVQPKDFNKTADGRPYAPPTEKRHFDPLIATLVQSVTRSRGAGYPPEVLVDSQKAQMATPWRSATRITAYPWPGTAREHQHFGALTPFEVMVTWFKVTLGTGYWFKKSCYAEHHHGSNPLGYDEPWESSDRIDIWYGTADALIRLCEAWARDVAETSFGTHVADGLQRYLAYMAEVPDDKRLTSMTTGELNAIAAAVNQRMVDEAAAAIGTVAAVGGAIAGAVATVPVVGWVTGLIVGLGTALATGFTALHIETRAMGTAFPGMVCPPGPFVRMLPDDGTNACDFDHRTFAHEDELEETGTRAEDRVGAQSELVAAAAAAGLPVEAWHAASEYGAGEVELDDVFDGPPPAGAEEEISWRPYFIVGGLLLGGAVLLKMVKK